MPWHHRTSLASADSILDNRFSAGPSGGVYVVQYPDSVWGDPKRMAAVWYSVDERLRDDLWADAILAIDIPDAVVWQNDLLKEARRADSVACLPPDVLNRYRRWLQAHEYAGDSREDLMKLVADLEGRDDPKGAAAVRAAIDVLTRRGKLPP